MSNSLSNGLSRHSGIIDAVFLLIASLVFLIIKSYGLNYAVSDENIYFYDAWLMKQGHWPYRDFFFAHPPFHLIPGWLVTEVMGKFSLTAMKMLPVVASLTSGIIIYFIAKKAGGIIAAVTACMMFLFSHDLLRASSHWTGINWSVLWLTAGFYAALNNRAVICGILLALGISTGIYIVPGALIIIAMLGIHRTRDALTCTVSLTGSLVLLNLPFIMAGGQEFYDNVIQYHLLKPPGLGYGFTDQLDNVMFHNYYLLTAPLYVLPVVLSNIFMNRGKAPTDYTVKSVLDPALNKEISIVLWCFSIWLAYISFLSYSARVFHYYFLLLFPFAAICGGLFVTFLISHIKNSVQSNPSRYAAAAMLAALIAGFFIYPRIEQGFSYYETRKGETVMYSMPRSPVPIFLQLPFLQLFWNEQRTIGDRYSGISYYLWHESKDFAEAQEIARVIHAGSGNGSTIFGDSTSTPLIALLAGIEVADHMIDTNRMRFRTGSLPPERVVEQLYAATRRSDQRLSWVLIKPGSGVAGVSRVMDFITDNFNAYRTFQTQSQGRYILMKGNSH